MEIKWEYKVLYIGYQSGNIMQQDTIIMEQLGQVGWELVTIVDRSAVFKRMII